MTESESQPIREEEAKRHPGRTVLRRQDFGRVGVRGCRVCRAEGVDVDHDESHTGIAPTYFIDVRRGTRMLRLLLEPPKGILT